LYCGIGKTGAQGSETGVIYEGVYAFVRLKVVEGVLCVQMQLEVHTLPELDVFD
jgi:hypothetical protein